ncbi:hypothetical protein ccbrp13_11900 [Ktedonobacteria bacterium brp13]|nr:hypothetical protein ccbrp13_11900 [Ktedonobacteria bacterium brp13]
MRSIRSPILLGLLREQQALAAQVLASLGIELDKTRTIIESQIVRSNEAQKYKRP